VTGSLELYIDHFTRLAI